MKKTIELRSRYGDIYTLIRIGGRNSRLFYFYNPEYIRFGEINSGKKFIDPSGGPMLVEGSYLSEAKATIKEIKVEDNITIRFL